VGGQGEQNREQGGRRNSGRLQKKSAACFVWHAAALSRLIRSENLHANSTENVGNFLRNRKLGASDRSSA